MQKELIDKNPILKNTIQFSLIVICNHLQNKLTEIQKILNSILGTAKRKTPISFLLSYFVF